MTVPDMFMQHWHSLSTCQLPEQHTLYLANGCSCRRRVRWVHLPVAFLTARLGTPLTRERFAALLSPCTNTATMKVCLLDSCWLQMHHRL